MKMTLLTHQSVNHSVCRQMPASAILFFIFYFLFRPQAALFFI